MLLMMPYLMDLQRKVQTLPELHELITQRKFKSSQEVSCHNRAKFYRIYKFVNINFSKVRSHAG
eukprot:13207291-Ditylum_brightwellii.AAC.1